MVERRSPKPDVVGSNPSWPAIFRITGQDEKEEVWVKWKFFEKDRGKLQEYQS